jgi:23S rRNA pseudouridine1911/1915/1917 synthase
MAMERFELTVPEENHLDRADVFLVNALETGLSRSYVQKLIKGGHILVNGGTLKANYKVKTGDALTVIIPEPEVLDITPEDIPLDIVYQDDSLAVINKPAGMVVHPSPGNWEHTMVNALLYHLRDLSSIGGTARPGIVHRLDKDTSGLMVVAKNDAAHRALTAAFAAREIDKRYAAVVAGKPKIAHELIDAPIGRHPVYRHKMTIREDGKEAVTELFCTKIWHADQGVFSLFDVRLHTGRTHQIRVHLSSRGLPIVGDPIYSKKWDRYRVPFLLLASVFLEFTHPATGERMSYRTDPPAHMLDFLKKLDKNT